MPNLDRIRLVVAALRSGEFPQTHKHLRDGVGYCCLGVVCELFRRDTGRGEWGEARGEEGVTDFQLDDVNSTGYMPADVTNWLGIDYNYGDLETAYINPKSEGDAGAVSIGGADMNDSGMSFEQIAEVIEYEYLSNGEPV